jgi:transposase InsO family protein
MDDKISEIYNDQTGFGSLASTYQDVKKKYPEITYKQVKDWYARNAEYNVRSTGYNSFVASAPLQEFQVDLFNMKSKKAGGEYTMGMAAIDVFSKFAMAVAIPDKKQGTLLEALKKVFKEMGKPKVLMTDEEGGLQSKAVGEFFKNEGITYIVNRNHSPFVERYIRTLKSMLSKRLLKRDVHWYDLLFEVFLVYNRKMVSSVTKMTPVEAIKKENQSQARMNALTQTKHNKAYPPVKVGDRVRLFRRRKHLSEKEEVPIWSKVAYEVVKVEDNPDAGKLYYLNGLSEKPILRSQLLLVKD